MFRMENSPEFEATMEAYRKKRERESARGKRQYDKARKAWEAAGRGWLPMKSMPFKAFDDMCGFDGAVLVSDGTARALATVKARFGRPMFWKTQPEMVYRDGMMHWVGGVEDPRDDLPAWWWEWELTDQFGSMTYAGGEETGKEEIDFVPTIWTFLPDPPASN